MLLLEILAGIGILSLIINKLFDNAFLSIIGVTAFSSLVIYLIAVLFLYYTTKAEIKDFQSVGKEFRLSIENGNFTNNPVLKFKVNDSNEWLSDAQDWNRSIFELCIPDEVDGLNFIK
jgi:hypothetical protein